MICRGCNLELERLASRPGKCYGNTAVTVCQSKMIRDLAIQHEIPADFMEPHSILVREERGYGRFELFGRHCADAHNTRPKCRFVLRVRLGNSRAVRKPDKSDGI